MTMVTQLKQILINQSKIKILAWNFQNITTWVTWNHLGDLLSPGPTLPHLPWPIMTMVNQLKQILINKPKLRYWPETFRIWLHGLLEITSGTYTHHLSWPIMTMVTQAKQILKNQPNLYILASNFQNMTKWVTWYPFWDLTSPGPTQPHLSWTIMTMVTQLYQIIISAKLRRNLVLA